MLRLRRPRSPALLMRRVAAGLLAATALVLAVRLEPAPARAGPTAVSVVVAARDLSPGTALAPGDLERVRWPPAARPDGAARTVSELAGRVLSGAVRRGEPLTDVRLVGARVTDVLPAGLVAAPVRLADLAVTGLVAAGDRVDVLAAGPEADRAEVVAAGAVVLAAPGPAPPDSSSDPSAGLLLLAVDPDTAAHLAAVATTATLTVSLPGR